MSSFRLLSLLVAVLAVCAGVSSGQKSPPTTPVSVAASPVNPTSGCYDPAGDSSYGNWTTDVGYFELWGLESYYSTDYSVLCAFRGYYVNDANGNTNVWGPWHGNNNDSHCDAYGETYFADPEYAKTGSGGFAFRTNAASGKSVMTSFRMTTSCDSSMICAGLCPGSPDYAKQQDDLESDPTYQVITINGNGQGVITTLNSTGDTVDVKDRSGVYPIAQVSVISSVQLCYGIVDQPCSNSSSGGGK